MGVKCSSQLVAQVKVMAGDAQKLQYSRKHRLGPTFERNGMEMF